MSKPVTRTRKFFWIGLVVIALVFIGSGVYEMLA